MHNLHFLKGTPNAFRFPEIRESKRTQSFQRDSIVYFHLKLPLLQAEYI